MNKILFRYKVNFGDDVILIANNERDLMDHINDEFNWYSVSIAGDQFKIIRTAGSEADYVDILWVKHI